METRHFARAHGGSCVSSMIDEEIYERNSNDEPSEETIKKILGMSWTWSIIDIATKANCTTADVRWVAGREKELREKYSSQVRKGKFPMEFVEKAIKRSNEIGVKATCREMNITQPTLSGWRKQYGEQE